MKTKFLLKFLGVFLVLDGLLSIYFGHSCLNSCLNNNFFGDAVRLFRTLIGGYLIYKFN